MQTFWTRTYDLLIKGGAAVAGFFHGMAAGQTRSAVFLAALMAADWLTGTLAAALGKSPKTPGGRLSSAAGVRGLLRKGLMLLAVALSWGLDAWMNDGRALFSTAALWFYISNEALSLLENLALCGVPIPARVRALLESAAEDAKAPPAPTGANGDVSQGASTSSMGAGSKAASAG